jgi:hypothetical protein
MSPDPFFLNRPDPYARELFEKTLADSEDQEAR